MNQAQTEELFAPVHHKYRKPHDKHFVCTSCENEVDHLTTYATVSGVNIVPKDWKLCDRCLNTWELKIMEVAMQRKNGKA